MVTLQGGEQEEVTTSVQQSVKEEHCPVCMYGPNSEKETYIETLKLEEGTGRALARQLVKTLEKQQSKDSVKVIGSDSCSKNTGWDNRVQACVEEELERPLQRVVCLKHTIEIVWHKYFIAIADETKSPTLCRATSARQLVAQHSSGPQSSPLPPCGPRGPCLSSARRFFPRCHGIRPTSTGSARPLSLVPSSSARASMRPC